MLGAGCHMRDKCPKYKNATKWHKEQYCDNPKGCDFCGERPMREASYAKMDKSWRKFHVLVPIWVCQ